MKISNVQILHAIFGDSYIQAHVTSFSYPPDAIPQGQQAIAWKGRQFNNTQLPPGENQYFTVSLFNESNRRKVNFNACYVIGLDDVKEKLPIEQVNRLPPPSVVMKSSLHSEQWLYLLATPETDIARVDNLHDGLIKNGLAPNSKDPGQKGVTRYLRLPEGVNNKAKRIAENNGQPYQCNVTEWHPERRYTLEQLAAPFGVDLNAPRRESRVDGAATLTDHPLLHTEAIKVKQTLSAGRFEITCPWVSEHTGKDDSGSAIFTNADGSIGFRCHHGSCDSRTGSDLLQFIETKDAGFKQRLKSWQMFHEFDSVKALSPVNNLDNTILTSSPLTTLKAFSAKGDSLKLAKGMLDEKFVLDGVAILGQWTVFYAEPNAGKTLLTLRMLSDAINRGILIGSNVFYVNADDTYRGGIEKLKLAEKYNFEMMIPNINNFNMKDLLPLMLKMAEQGEANGQVIILDTLKKFTDLMDKKMSSEFGNIARMFVASGGTIVTLAHVNKVKGLDGLSIHAGTSDIKDDCDCVYIIEVLNRSDTKTTVEFNNVKARGDVFQTVSYEYTRNNGDSYTDVFESVKRITKDEIEINKDAEIIEAINTGIVNELYSKSSLIHFAMSESDGSRREVDRVLDKYEGRLWIAEKGKGNSLMYRFNKPPETVSFF